MLTHRIAADPRPAVCAAQHYRTSAPSGTAREGRVRDQETTEVEIACVGGTILGFALASVKDRISSECI